MKTSKGEKSSYTLFYMKKKEKEKKIMKSEPVPYRGNQ